MASLSEKTFLLALGKAAKGLGYLAFSVGVARLYDTHQYAAFQAWWTIYMVVVPIVEGGFTAGLYHRLPRLTEAVRNGLVWRTYLLLAALGLALTAALYALAPYLAGLFGFEILTEQLRAAAAFIGFALPLFVFQAWLLVENKAGTVALLDIAGAVMMGTALLLPSAWQGTPAEGLLFLSAFAVARTLVVGLFLHKRLRVREAADHAGQMAYAAHVSLSRATGVLTKQIDRFFVGAYATPHAFATYATGALELPLINVLTGSAATVLQPEISRRLHASDRDGAVVIWRESVRKIALFLFPAGTAAAVLAVPLLGALYGESYAAAGIIFQIFALALPLRAAQYGAVFLAAGDTKTVLAGSAAALAVNTTLCIFLVPVYGGVGAAAATVATVYGLVFFYVRRLRSVFERPIAALFPWKSLISNAAVCAVAGLIAGLAAASVSIFFDGYWLPLTAGSAAFVVIWLPVAWKAGVLAPADRARIERYVTERLHA